MIVYSPTLKYVPSDALRDLSRVHPGKIQLIGTCKRPSAGAGTLAKILMVEDEAEFASMVQEKLTSQNHVVDWVNNGKDGLERIKFYSYDLAILDWELPEMEGIEILRAYRTGGGVMPILMLTGKATIDDKTDGFQGGVDDYLTKPCHLDELVLRVRSLLRRQTADRSTNNLKVRNIELDPNKCRVTREGAEIRLNAQEFSLFEFLLRHPEEVFSAEALQDRVWSSDADVSPAAVRMAIVRLRKKIQDSDANPIIRTLHRVGYRLDP